MASAFMAELHHTATKDRNLRSRESVTKTQVREGLLLCRLRFPIATGDKAFAIRAPRCV
jgi:hypothetical protein